MDGEFPHELKAVFGAYEVQSNPWGCRRTRAATGPRTPVRVVAAAGDLGPRLAVLRRLGAVVRPAGPEDRPRIRPGAAAAGVPFASWGRARRRPAMRPPRRQRDAVPAAGAGARRDASRELGVTRIVTCDPHAFNSPRRTNIRPSAAAGRSSTTRSSSRGSLAAGRIASRPEVERVLYHEPATSVATTASSRHRAGSCAISRGTSRWSSASRARRRCAAGPAGRGCGWRSRSASRINVTRVEQALPHAPRVIATACPYCAVMMADGVSALWVGRARRSWCATSPSSLRPRCSATVRG